MTAPNKVWQARDYELVTRQRCKTPTTRPSQGSS
ncbi:hypothetical protein C7405_112135 [Paraburkholderia caballeronis]|nr:hypothetical protein C7405_112135 [Paraburkholderia caballeronis]